MQRVKTATAVANKPPYSEDGIPGYCTKGDPVAAIPATVPGQDWFNMVQEEILNVITAAGLAPSATDDTQLAQAIAELIAAQAVEVQPATETVAGILKLAALAQAIAGTNTATAMTPADVAAAALSGTGRVAVAAGTADALTATVPSAQTALIHGMSMLVRAAAANATTTPTFALTLGATAIGAKGIVGPAGTALGIGAISGAGHWLALTYDATLDKWVLGNPAHNAAAGYTGSLAASGWCTLPNGLVFQWGTTGTIPTDSSLAVTFPITFPHAAWIITGNGVTSYIDTSYMVQTSFNFPALSATGFTVTNDYQSNSVRWFALGW